ncbi:chemotaxis protein CheW [Thiobaca trueperi]|uniref:Purine-binding chemotaxis protein CheW n=1 Tax=Thiobaca trueperi TaxID=127458 RepID=A0A4R3MVE5_9GAMM|nr:chemotaxis protein CheW [Thiobaca trueperi]TCT20294.1 purine-binding chemotaxis protein CheW [Thiobaca trueperi]
MAPERDQLAEILEQRRQAGAGIVTVDAPALKLVIFAIGDACFAFPGSRIIEILPLTTIHFVPGCPAFLEGVINVRGDIDSVIRLGDLLGAAHAPTDRHTSILLGQGRAGDPPVRSGLRVDRVLDVLDVIESSIQPPPETLPEPLRGLASGVLRHREQTVIVLDLERLFHAIQHRAGVMSS